IGSGPTAPDSSTFGEALAILDRFDLRARTPVSVRGRLEQGARGAIAETPKPDDPMFARVQNAVIGNNQIVVEAAAARAAAPGSPPRVWPRRPPGGARGGARALGARGRATAAGGGPGAPPACVIAGGETTVTIRGAGRGGRCQELALAAAIEMAG